MGYNAKSLKEVDTTEWLIISSFKYKLKKLFVCLFYVSIVIGWMSSIQVMEYHIQPGPFPATKKHKSFPAERNPACFCQNIVTWSPGPFHYHSPFSTTRNYGRKIQEYVNRRLTHLSFTCPFENMEVVSQTLDASYVLVYYSRNSIKTSQFMLPNFSYKWIKQIMIGKSNGCDIQN